MKLVYLAEDLRLVARPCALAEMVDSFSDLAAQRQAIAAFQREADMLAHLSNEHIPRIYDRFSEQNRHYLVMEFIDGATLEQEIVRAAGKLDQARVIDIALQVLDTLEYLHNLNPPVIYRDLKPSNVMLTKGGLVKLIDFGIARLFQPQSNATMIGTQGYAPPEQYRGRAEARSDLYALGATMHHALSGRDPAAEPPFSFPKLRTLCPDLNPALAQLTDQALEYDVIHRTADAPEFKHRLLAIKAELASANGEKAPVPPPGARSQLRLPLGASAPAPAAAPNAATLLSQAADVTCGACRRIIPADSHFCSFCGAELGPVANGGLRADPDAATRDLQSFAPPPQTRARSDSPWPHHPLRLLVAVVISLAALGFLTAGLVTYLRQGKVPSPPPAYPVAPGPGYGGGEPANRSPRGVALRRLLDAAGYNSVHFRIDGDTAILWGTVPSQLDRVEIQTMVFATGIYSLEDHMVVRGNSFGGAP
jgi:serine/threonine protein kinase